MGQKTPAGPRAGPCQTCGQGCCRPPWNHRLTRLLAPEYAGENNFLACRTSLGRSGARGGPDYRGHSWVADRRVYHQRAARPSAIPAVTRAAFSSSWSCMRASCCLLLCCCSCCCAMTGTAAARLVAGDAPGPL